MFIGSCRRLENVFRCKSLERSEEEEEVEPKKRVKREKTGSGEVNHNKMGAKKKEEGSAGGRTKLERCRVDTGVYSERAVTTNISFVLYVLLLFSFLERGGRGIVE